MSGVNDPPRLFETADAPASLRAALSSAHEDGIGLGAVERIAAGVEAQIGTAGAPTDGSGSTSGPDASGTADPGTGSSLLPTSPAGKLGAALVVAAVVGGGLWMASKPDSGPEHGSAPVSPPAASVSSADDEADGQEDSSSETAATTFIDLDEPDPGAAARAQRLANPGGTAAGAPSKARPSLEELQVEHQLLRAARNALDRDPKRALALTQEHKRRFPDGTLAQEREVIAIEALNSLGKSSAARSRADQFGDDYPDSPHGDRVEAAAADGGAKK